jgi:hypothetical protein
MEMLHEQHTNVLECDTDVFIGNSPADLTQYLDMTNASQVQNWLLNIWKPFILSSVKSSTELSLRGVHTITTYFPDTNTARRPINNRSHHTACPQL